MRNELKNAIELSITENRSVAVEYTGDVDSLTGDLCIINGDCDHATENDGTIDAWGTDNDGQEWRLAVTLLPRGEAYNTGYEARKQGDSENPYAPGGWDAEQWEDGYAAAE